MKNIILVSILFLTTFCNAQTENLTRLVGDTLYSRTGFKITKDQQLKMGTGTMPDGDFKYIRIAATSLFQYTGNDRGAVNSANSLPATSGGLQYKVIRIDQYGNKKRGFTYFPIINVGAVRYQIDIENAISSGELDVPEQYRPKAKPLLVEIMQPASLADELEKLKKLYADSVLTKQEFEAAKKKLLEN